MKSINNKLFNKKIILLILGLALSACKGGEAKDEIDSKEKIDETAPVISVTGGEINIDQYEAYIEPGVSALDDVDGELAVITSDLELLDTAVPGEYTITYTATDTAGNVATATRAVTVVAIDIVTNDTVAPVITLDGNAQITVYQGNAYTDGGATAIDDVDGNATVTTDGAVDIYTVGAYVITYSATDVAGNLATATRTVNVVSRIIIANYFDTDTCDWSARGASVKHDTTEGHNANGTLKVTNRFANYSGPKFHLENQLTIGETYTISVWIKLANLASGTSTINVGITANNESPTYQEVSNLVTVSNSKWTQVTATYTHSPVGTVSELYLFIKGPQNVDKAEDFHIDDFSIEVYKPTQALLADGLEEGITNWGEFASTLTLETTEVHAGLNSMSVTGRSKNYSSPKYSLNAKLIVGETYHFSVWVKLHPGAAGTAQIMIKQTDDDGVSYKNINNTAVTVADNAWTQLSGYYTHTANGDVSDIFAYIKGPSTESNLGSFYLDDFLVTFTPVFLEVTVDSLKALAEFPIGVGGIDVGNTSRSLLKNHDKQIVVNQHFNQLTPGNVMKMKPLVPNEHAYTYDAADALVAYAEDNGLSVHGHVLVWHSQIPNWVESYSGSASDWTAMMEDHITEVVTHYNGKLKSWDVVNEAFNEDGTYRNTGSKGSVWYQNIGVTFIEKAFLAARAADANVELYYNDYNLASATQKISAVAAMAADFKARNIPINGIGFQMHLRDSSVDKAKLSAHFKKIVDLGLKVKITELDIKMNTGNADSQLTVNDAEIQKQRYFDVISTYLEVVPPTQRGGISVWGVADPDSWLINKLGHDDWPLLFNGDHSAKPALQGFADALATDPFAQ